jgi:hypothetical protein
LIVLFSFVLFSIAGCVNDDVERTSFRDDPKILTLNGTWKVLSYEDHTNNTVDKKTQQNSQGLDIIIALDDTSAPHKLSGTNTTNAVFGEFEYSGNRIFKVLKYSSTFIAQPVWG